MQQDTFALPSIYSQNLANRDQSLDDFDSPPTCGDLQTQLPSRATYREQHVEDNRLAWLMLGTALSTLLLTLVPVVAKIPNITPWFPGNTLWRLLDPLITLPLNLFIMTRADIISTGGRPNYWGALSERSVTWLFWSLGAAIFVQGHGVHTAASMFKHPVEDFNDAHPDIVAQYPVLHEIYLYMEDLWEHYIAHYMYAGGAMWMSWVQLFAFRNQVHGPLPVSTKAVWVIGSVFYGLLLAAVAIEFPAGTYGMRYIEGVVN
ncbi:hypothetical protein DFQ28_000484 [Apophysomyces sp. BC1034]|nr:hypothetical protein DFQ30_000859 [Apophysomyces sp. BC1015]KAG0167547.1 hypothetical protein DFQ29_000363 [Apophysomyces sp. BC1021]KAG0183924.1 hypothetical protein DFQ28_000484 [Apophysomyces sp. BC1034]